VAAVPWSWLRAQGLASVDDVRAHVAARREGALVVMRRVDGVGKKVDVGALLDALTVDEGDDAVRAAGYVGELLALRFRTRVLPTGAAKAMEVVEALFGPEAPARYIRTAMGRLRDGVVVSPMTLDAQRVVKPAPEEPEAPTTNAATDA
jgi:hypothetical protein